MKSFRIYLLCSHWLTIFLILCCHGERTILNRKCGVEDPKIDRPQTASAPYVPEIERVLIENTIQRQDLDAYNALLNSNLKCKEHYLVPIAWHVIYNSQGLGNVSDVMLEDQVRVLNSKNFFQYCFPCQSS